MGLSMDPIINRSRMQVYGLAARRLNKTSLLAPHSAAQRCGLKST